MLPPPLNLIMFIASVLAAPFRLCGKEAKAVDNDFGAKRRGRNAADDFVHEMVLAAYFARERKRKHQPGHLARVPTMNETETATNVWSGTESHRADSFTPDSPTSSNRRWSRWAA
jgi:hypothetical protein